MSVEPFRIGLIGAGIMGQLRARAIRRIGYARIVAVAEVDGQQVEAVRHVHPGVRLLPNGETLAREEGIDGVIIGTAAVTHEPLGLACLDAGKHVLCEKPLAKTVDECQRLIDAAQTARRCLATGFMLRHTPAAQLARQLVDSGSIGRVDHVRAFHGHSGTEYFGPDWKVDAAETGGGCLMNGGNHLIDLVRWFLGDISEIVGVATEGVWRQRGCEDNGFLLMRTADGRVGQLQASWAEWRGYRYSVDIYGTDGYVRFGYSPLWLAWAHGKRGDRMKAKRHLFPRFQLIERVRGWRWSLTNALEADLRGWIDAAKRGHEPPASSRDGLEAVRAAQAVNRLASFNSPGPNDATPAASQ
jgi:predicted dehydrogenase